MRAQVGPKTNFRQIRFPLRRLNASLDARKVGPRKTHDVFESLLHMVHVLQPSQKLRLASKKWLIFSALFFPSDVGEFWHPRGPQFFFQTALGPKLAPSELLRKMHGCLGPQRVKNSIVFALKPTSPKWAFWRSTNQSKSLGWPKMAMMRISQKSERWKKSVVTSVKVASGPHTLPLRSHEGPSWA